MANITKIKVSGVTYNIVDSSAIHDLSDYSTTEQVNSAITAATNALAESIAEQGYQTSGDVQNAISGKADSSAVTQDISAATSGKLDTSVFETYSGNVDTALGTKFAGASWNSTDKKIYFYDNSSNTGTALTYIDASDFVKDGFLSSVTIDDRKISGETVPCLVFIWNTDSGLQETDIPLSDIFDPTNYVDINTYSAYTAATEAVLSGKADSSTVEGINNVLTAHTADTTIHVTSSDKTTWSGKQDALVNQVNIKSINGTSLLGSGDLQVQSLPTVSGTTLIFS